MLRSALLALDTTKASAAVVKLAIRFCKRQEERHGHSVKLTAVAVVNRPFIEKSQAEPIGATIYKQKRDEKLLEEARAKTVKILNSFEKQCQAENVPCAAIRSEGFPHEQIEAAARCHDLIIIGKDTNFQTVADGKTGDTVKHLVRDHPRPVIVVPEKIPQSNEILIAYGGSIQASHALHIWALLDIRRDNMNVNVLSVHSRLAEAEASCAEAAALLSHHDIRVKQHPIEAKKSEIFDKIKEKIDRLKPQIIVMGAFGQGGLKAKFFGSVTQKMLKTCPAPLFIYQ